MINFRKDKNNTILNFSYVSLRERNYYNSENFKIKTT